MNWEFIGSIFFECILAMIFDEFLLIKNEARKSLRKIHEIQPKYITDFWTKMINFPAKL